MMCDNTLMTTGSTTITFAHDVRSAVQASLDALVLAETWARNGAGKESWAAKAGETREHLEALVVSHSEPPARPPRVR